MPSRKETFKIIVICGPTGTGKTGAAIQVAQSIGACIVSADSMQVYRFMDIGTAKPNREEQDAVAHYMIDVVNPDDDFNAQRYVTLADRIIADLQGRNIPVLVVGGTGLYIRALRYGLFSSPKIDPSIRTALRDEAMKNGLGAIYEKLKRIDPESAAILHPNDRQRILRALEVSLSSGRPYSSFVMAHGFHEERYRVRMIGLFRNRENLYHRIDRRVDSMLESGFQAEVEGLLNRGYSPALPSMQALGYRHLVDCIEGRLSWDEAVRTLKRDTRRYAKRQMTWFNREKDIIWIDADRTASLNDAVREFLC
ncbi:tRNA (adenosine(37)-N6)-dimethylallyltransferase MiaA [Desulfatirhabdium butyrativorans]|uniref:tRNA (adenosine(37)-N6)-dimethylallyltransferase MiaA n=1 Tax=Desulfatirhabdium butyrativorans TaxID=340467 RepID=UPI00041E1400|nr:tRNA (adenosine(37)-N6)-dimethylallyltransferase MiaA [Desulfatirhabdium butyrativorans]